MWTGENDSNTLWMRVFFWGGGERRGEKSPFTKISGYVWTRPVITGALNILTMTNLMSYLFQYSRDEHETFREQYSYHSAKIYLK